MKISIELNPFHFLLNGKDMMLIFGVVSFGVTSFFPITNNVLIGVLLALPLLYSILFFYSKSRNREKDLVSFFKEELATKRIKEIKIIKKIIIFVIPILLVFSIISLTGLSVILDKELKSLIGERFILRVQIALSYILVLGLLALSPILLYKEFYYHAAKLCITKSTTYDDSLDKTNLLILGLNLYDLFLKRNLGLKFKDNDQLFSAIICYLCTDRKKFSESLSKSFDGIDKLEPVQIVKPLVKNQDEILVKTRLREKIKGSSSIIISYITAIISIISLFL